MSQEVVQNSCEFMRIINLPAFKSIEQAIVCTKKPFPKKNVEERACCHQSLRYISLGGEKEAHPYCNKPKI